MNQNQSSKKLPQSSILAEEVVIGQILSDLPARQYIAENTISSFFTLQKYRVLYRYCITNAKQKHNTALIINNLWDQQLLKDIGGVSHILKIINRSQAVSMYYGKYIYIRYCIKVLQRNYAIRLFTQYSYSVIQLNQLHRISMQQMQKKARRYLSIACENARPSTQTEFRKSISRFLNQINRLSNQSMQILSGFRDLDNITQGFKDGELIVIAGRPSMGKTSFAINIAHHNIFSLKAAVHIFSLEMSKQEIIDKLVALASSVSIRKIQQKLIEKYEWSQIQDACKFLISSSLHINDQESSSVNDIKKQYMHYLSKKKVL